ncbi:hypothetical protein HAX54_028752 [Datura stramonium]|uniref:Uncharacterized protein n=1 Tax=Datura stramonium TaxID=4076 RepID=A0ABS8V799_DATST|nr:hypothetical protein [Datura stramonium]
MATRSPIHNILDIKTLGMNIIIQYKTGTLSLPLTPLALEDPFAYCLAVTTRSAKVLNLEPRMTVEEEIHDGEKLGPNVDIAPREVNDEGLSEEVNEELKVEAPLPLIKPLIPNPPFPQ